MSIWYSCENKKNILDGTGLKPKYYLTMGNQQLITLLNVKVQRLSLYESTTKLSWKWVGSNYY